MVAEDEVVSRCKFENLLAGKGTVVLSEVLREVSKASGGLGVGAEAALERQI